MEEFIDNGCCFVCGKENPIGLKIHFCSSCEGDGAEAEVTFPPHFQGWEGVVHGGLLSTVLDEMLIQAAGQKQIKCVTAELTVKFIAPARTGIRYRLEGKVLGERGRLVTAESRILDPDGKELARATGKLIKI